ncbi:hypothetical protein HNQ02_003286 [Flavobacterium sp. 7E]|uniref:hypothetical protein n=1 Tax=Flavobacterium sp. 7E TaxID=2735898 RepID=UPI00156EABA8|nr:hypothetical protein [Flavobacterium sp. 7E]NRS90346.1 hypothetical protein [Flavobacterium sp. 7E]
MEIQSNFDNKFITIIYGVANEKELGISMFHWWKTIEIPSDGILFTSSDFDENLSKTKIKFNSGIYLRSKETDGRFGEMNAAQVIINGKKYKYRTWTLQKGYCCTFPIEDEIIVKNNVKNKLLLRKVRK